MYRRILDIIRGNRTNKKATVVNPKETVDKKELDKQRQQCIAKWNENRNRIFIDGRSLAKIYESKRLLSNAEPDLETIWRDLIIEKITEDQQIQDKILALMQQGAYLDALLPALTQQISEDSKGEFSLDSKTAIRTISISTSNGRILIEDSFDIPSLSCPSIEVDNNGDVQQELNDEFQESLEVVSTSGNIPKIQKRDGKSLISATATFALDLNANASNNPTFLTKKVAVFHNNELTKLMLHDQGIFQKIESFLKSIYDTAKELLAPKSKENQEHKISYPYAVTKSWDEVKVPKDENQTPKYTR